jgi:hypothetical protein
MKSNLTTKQAKTQNHTVDNFEVQEIIKLPKIEVNKPVKVCWCSIGGNTVRLN